MGTFELCLSTVELNGLNGALFCSCVSWCNLFCVWSVSSFLGCILDY